MTLSMSKIALLNELHEVVVSGVDEQCCGRHHSHATARVARVVERRLDLDDKEIVAERRSISSAENLVHRFRRWQPPSPVLEPTASITCSNEMRSLCPARARTQRCR